MVVLAVVASVLLGCICVLLGPWGVQLVGGGVCVWYRRWQ